MRQHACLAAAADIPGHTWKRMAASTASTLSLKSKGTSAERVMAILSSRCSLRGPSSGLKVAISSGRHLYKPYQPQTVPCVIQPVYSRAQFLIGSFHNAYQASYAIIRGSTSTRKKGLYCAALS